VEFFVVANTTACDFPHSLFPFLDGHVFLAAVGFWDFLGAFVFRFLINLPIVSYYEIGTALTVNHGHAAMMGVYGMMAVRLALFLFALHRSGRGLE
jgi:nitric oxide reductase subunit B